MYLAKYFLFSYVMEAPTLNSATAKALASTLMHSASYYVFECQGTVRQTARRNSRLKALVVARAGAVLRRGHAQVKPNEREH